ncbi:UDP-GalNAc:beta-1,3-N-acetylgalactosaminyltransferase 2-like [Macrobrachium nipponense]|uniref:UDP-GalNAc:beta-1, 3-N-acetylgalactosaminyltransferase 2-like n=1 Tax=Macrobrachium nipponense TaxID=159736 RepID=UPI0030C812BD
MDSRWLFIGGAVVAATFAFIYLGAVSKDVGKVSSKHLIIGVISARDHFLQRDAIRRTWGSQISKLPNSELLFVVGDDDCPYHPDDRMSPYDCDEWNILSTDFEASGLRRFFRSDLHERRTHVECYVGIGFKIFHPVLLMSVSVSMEFLLRVRNCTLILVDAEEVLEEVKVNLRSCSDTSEKNAFCDIKLASPLFLPRQFEGELRVFSDGIGESDLCGQSFFSLQQKENWVCDWVDTSVIHFKYLRSVRDSLVTWRGKSCPLLSAVYSIADRDVLKKHVESKLQRSFDWKEHLDFVLKKLAIEQVVHRDLLVLSHQDIYSTLPLKVMLVLRRLTQDFDFKLMMKVDDDTFVNISSLKMLMDTEADSLPKMWSHFHHHRSVPCMGKMSPCISGSLAQALAQAGPYMTSYVGEDVSMGIWISSAVNNATLIDVPCWLPRSECQETVLVSQLSPIDMLEMWKEN